MFASAVNSDVRCSFTVIFSPQVSGAAERYTLLYQQCSACQHDGNTDRDWHARADTHGESVVERQHVVDPIRL